MLLTTSTFCSALWQPIPNPEVVTHFTPDIVRDFLSTMVIECLGKGIMGEGAAAFPPIMPLSQPSYNLHSEEGFQVMCYTVTRGRPLLPIGCQTLLAVSL